MNEKQYCFAICILTKPSGPTFGAKADGLPTSPPVTRRTTKIKY